jgi:hypothetical protein
MRFAITVLDSALYTEFPLLVGIEKMELGTPILNTLDAVFKGQRNTDTV